MANDEEGCIVHREIAGSVEGSVDAWEQKQIP